MGKKKYTKEELLEILIKQYAASGELKYSYFRNENGLPSRSTYDNFFGTWKNALELAKIPKKLPTPKNLKKKKKRTKKIIRNKKSKWNENSLKEGFITLYNEIGYTPSSKNIKECLYLPSLPTFFRHCKSIGKMCEECDLEIKRFSNKVPKIKKAKIKIKTHKVPKASKIKKELYVETRIVEPPEEEIWKSLILKGIKNYYEISNLGNVKNKNTNRIIKTFDNKGYRTVGLRNNNKRQTIFLVHRLVAIAFLDLNENNKNLIVHHINSNTSCNHINNLEVCTLSQNSIYAQNHKIIRAKPQKYTYNLELEEWKDVIKYEGLYMVSNYGRVKNKKNYFMTQSINGYKTVSLVKNGKSKSCKVHRLVAIAFLTNLNNYPVVNHKDGNKENNNVGNLEWCTYSQNSEHAHLNGLIKKSNKFSEEDIINIINMFYFKNYKIIKISQYYNINKETIKNIVKFKCKKYEKYKYLLNS